MRLANVNGRLTTFVEGAAVDVAEHSAGRFSADPQAVYEQWDEFVRWAEGIGASGDGALDGTVGAPAPAPRQVFAIGVNYRDHADEAAMTVPDIPVVFTKFPTCLVGPDHPVLLAGDTTDWEIELVAVIGRHARQVPADQGWDHVAGVTIGQDLSERTVQLAGPAPQFSLGKSFPGYGPTGPWLVTPEELAHRDDLEMTCTIDGETVQNGRTSSMIFSVPALVAELSKVCPLLPGDVIFTGTPSGVGFARTPARYLSGGQQLSSTIDGIGTLRTTLVKADM